MVRECPLNVQQPSVPRVGQETDQRRKQSAVGQEESTGNEADSSSSRSSVEQ